MKFFALFFTLLCCTTSALATDTSPAIDSVAVRSDSLPTRIHIGYTVTTGIGHGELNEVVDIEQKNDAHTFSITSNAQATGIFKVIKPGNIVRNSRGLVTQNGLQPHYYSDQRSGGEPSLVLFDWESGILTMKHKGKETQHTLTADTIDRLSLSYQFIFAADTETHAKILADKLFEAHVTDGRSLQLMRFSVNSEKLMTPLGDLETLVLTKLFDQDDTMQRKIWLAPDYHMIPVRIQTVEKDGLEVEKMIAELSLSYDQQDASCCNR